MSESSMKKWPVDIKIVKVATSSFGQELNIYFISGVMNSEQCKTLKERLPIFSEFQIDSEKVVIATIANQQQIIKCYLEFQKLAKEWRGQYYVLTNKFVEACVPIIEP